MRSRIWKYVRSYRFNSLFVRTYLLILVLAIVPLAGVSYYLARYYQEAAIRQTVTVNESEAAQIRASFDQLVTQVYRLIADIGTNYKVLGFMTAEQGALSTDERYFLHRDIDMELLHPFRSMPVVHTVNLAAFESGLTISSDRGMRDIYGTDELLELENQLAAHHGRVGWFGVRTTDYPTREHRLTLYWRLPPHTPELLGTVFVEFNSDALRRLLSATDAAGFQTLLLDESETILVSADQALVGMRLAELGTAPPASGPNRSAVGLWRGSDAIISRSPSRYGVSLVGVLELSSLAGEFATGRARVATIIAVFAVVGVVIAFLISVRAFRPIVRVLDLVEHAEDEPGIDVPPTRSDEVRHIARAIGDMVASRKEATNELKRRVAALRRARQTALQAQINPHFLNNTLETIRWKAMSMTGDENEVSVLITQLSKLLRSSLEISDELVPLRAEVDHGRLYMDLQQARYGDRFSLSWEIAAECEATPVPRFTLQPLLENALYHGVKPTDRRCRISVRAFCRDGHQVVAVEDDGAGIPANQLVALNRDLECEVEIDGRHIGLRNVNQRVKLMFGERYGVRVRARSAGGTVVEVEIPGTNEEDAGIRAEG
ncbi:MAG: sensor histidine kinase [Spirochaetota bacterium]